MATHHVRHPSHHSKKALPAHARPARPAALSKRTHSYGKSNSKVVHQTEVESEDDDESMALWTSLSLNVTLTCCSTVCEKQIVVPSNSVLYCSESCRKTDSEKSLTHHYDHYSPPTTPFGSMSFEDLTFRDIVPQRSPTQPESKRSSCAFSDFSSDDNTQSSDEKSQRSDSEASRYLRKFQASSYSTETVRPYRPRYSRASTSQVSFSTAPSLSHTPASSVSYSLPYTPAYPAPTTSRPLPPRNNPHNSSYGSKSIDLVTPLTAPSSPKYYSHKTPPISRTSISTIEGEIVYAKSPVPSLSAANGSLSLLISSTPRA
ncbi:hypothetical protein BKA66DRAFT_513791 [Pyrenochaeta sp. MPI-SDFR-AT-0127]|nr:hypothetical protein BKA66DRAFT_513791 [Pyrenochaeta sp. MPI-SDFR-AT-0127]